jgi:hypothetical protein
MMALSSSPILPNLAQLVAWLGARWSALGGSIRTAGYPTGAQRDLRLDLLRGFCVFAMVVDHIGGSSWLYALTGGNRWLVSAAEGFVFLSGLTMGLVYREKVRRLGLRVAANLALRRAVTLYLLTVALTLIFTALAQLTDLALWTDRALAEGEPLELLVGALTLHYTYHGSDILALYTLLVAVSPLLFYLLDEGRVAEMVAGSWLLWVGYQLFPIEFAFPWSIRNGNYFPLAAWQVLFVGGLALGWHRQVVSELVKDRLTVLRRAPVLLSLASPTLAMGSIGWIDRRQLAGLAWDPAVSLFAKSNLGPGRLVLFLVLFTAAYLLLTVAWKPCQRLFGRLLLPLGQNALYGYAMQLFLLLPLYNLFAVGSEDPASVLYNTAGQLVAVGALWAMVRTRFLFRIVPR